MKDSADFYYMVMIYNTSLVLQSIHENLFEIGIWKHLKSTSFKEIVSL